ncbi:uncharacterized protein N7529_009163 [Penicillium soppii]|jgi:hypothetical protein|uniref:uncharacterized protein n=1 Tax=Penicillium soppii TaxID=69789 RepID=UPI002547D8DD|nr:uncharacterized protein N7529_009163 [Penicillium soppii]KAJ5861853.1 hypothetical protein N7529_009163 [Penicillium soppii]
MGIFGSSRKKYATEEGVYEAILSDLSSLQRPHIEIAIDDLALIMKGKALSAGDGPFELKQKLNSVPTMLSILQIKRLRKNLISIIAGGPVDDEPTGKQRNASTKAQPREPLRSRRKPEALESLHTQDSPMTRENPYRRSNKPSSSQGSSKYSRSESSQSKTGHGYSNLFRYPDIDADPADFRYPDSHDGHNMGALGNLPKGWLPFK